MEQLGICCPQASFPLPQLPQQDMASVMGGVPSGPPLPARDTPGHARCTETLPSHARPGGLGIRRVPAGASPLRLQLCLVFQQHRVPLQPLSPDLPARVPEELHASSALLLEEHFSVLPQMAQAGTEGLAPRCSYAHGPACACPGRQPLTQCPRRRATTSSPDVIFPEIWLVLVLPPKKGCGDPRDSAGERPAASPAPWRPQ